MASKLMNMARRRVAHVCQRSVAHLMVQAAIINPSIIGGK
jgi:hypothetical protein